LLCTIALAAGVLIPRAAHADKVDTLIDQLTESSDYKVRLSAGLNLAKLGDARAIPAFLEALDDEDKTVRGVAAASLGKIIDSSTEAKLRNDAIAALKKTASKDGNAFVRKQAQKAFSALKGLAGGGSSAPRAGSSAKVYIDVGPMSAKTSEASKMRTLMRSTTEQMFTKGDASMTTTWSGGTPTKKELSTKKMAAFHVDGTLETLDVSTKGSSTTVTCKISMLLATFPEKSMFGFSSGGASVQGGSSSRDVALAKEDCVVAVVESLVGSKLIPTIQTRTK
jgi:hypothetical protein